MWTEHTEYEEYHKICARYSDISTITHSAKYRLIIEKIHTNIEISFFFNIAHPYS